MEILAIAALQKEVHHWGWALRSYSLRLLPILLLCCLCEDKMWLTRDFLGVRDWQTVVPKTKDMFEWCRVQEKTVLNNNRKTIVIPSREETSMRAWSSTANVRVSNFKNNLLILMPHTENSILSQCDIRKWFHGLWEPLWKKH